jgi:hypothetical protein
LVFVPEVVVSCVQESINGVIGGVSYSDCS